MKARSVAGALVAVALAGCSAHVHVGGTVDNGVSTIGSTTSTATLDSTKLASVVERLTEQRGLAAQTVGCPSNIPEQAGRLTTCVAYYKGGQTGQFRVLQKDTQGNVHITAAEMISPEVDDQIEHFLTPANSFTATCPAHVPIAVGKTFRCTATRGGLTVTILVHITDADGGFHLSVA
jgi:Domain of unknown function (DUF4333)